MKKMWIPRLAIVIACLFVIFAFFYWYTSNKEDSVLTKEDLKIVMEKWPNAVKTDSGLMYVVNEEGEGEAPKTGTLVTAHYTGTLLDGSKFDSSVDRGKPFQFYVGTGQVIKGWDEAFLGMKKGEKRTIILPYTIAYGEAGHPPVIPQKATLVFDVEMINF
jgi:FKBP-type peptidyl-prolyl cis-trans isomerase